MEYQIRASFHICEFLSEAAVKKQRQKSLSFRAILCSNPLRCFLNLSEHIVNRINRHKSL